MGWNRRIQDVLMIATLLLLGLFPEVKSNLLFSNSRGLIDHFALININPDVSPVISAQCHLQQERYGSNSLRSRLANTTAL